MVDFILLIIAVWIALVLIDDVKSTYRRKSHMGEDQILIQTDKDKAVAASIIADILEDVMYASYGELYEHKKIRFDLTNALIGLIAGLVIYAIVVDSNTLPGTINTFFGILLITTTFSGVIMTSLKDVKIDYIVFDKFKGSTTLVRLDIYDDNGYRLIHENEIFRIKYHLAEPSLCAKNC